jgi:hypothetical protein
MEPQRFVEIWASRSTFLKESVLARGSPVSLPLKSARVNPQNLHSACMGSRNYEASFRWHRKYLIYW